MNWCQISCESKLTRVIAEIGSLQLHFNSRDACVAKIGGLETRAMVEACGEKVWRSSKSMEHNVDNVCKHNILRFALFPLDLRLWKCNQAISAHNLLSHWYINVFLAENSAKKVLTIIAIAPYPLASNTRCCVPNGQLSPIGLLLSHQDFFFARTPPFVFRF